MVTNPDEYLLAEMLPSLDRYEGSEPATGAMEPVRRATPEVGRNEPCPCGSGKKYRKCHGR